MKLFAALILSSLAFAQPGICDEVVNCVDLTGTYELVGDDGLILERKIVQDGCKSLTADQLVTWREQTHQFDGLLKKANGYCENEGDFVGNNPRFKITVTASIDDEAAQFNCTFRLREPSDLLQSATMQVILSKDSTGNLVMEKMSISTLKNDEQPVRHSKRVWTRMSEK
ncbi:MAG: hypothetical protein AAB425_12735 [Bdellovibrionota bacterium]